MSSGFFGFIGAPVLQSRTHVDKEAPDADVQQGGRNDYRASRDHVGASQPLLADARVVVALTIDWLWQDFGMVTFDRKSMDDTVVSCRLGSNGGVISGCMC